MTMPDISPEDRERLAKTKFGEWFDEFWDKKFGESFEKAVTETRGRSQHPAQQQQSNQPEPTHQQPHRKRSLLEECFSSTFGF